MAEPGARRQVERRVDARNAGAFDPLAQPASFSRAKIDPVARVPAG